jgi:inner membrane protein
MWSALSFLPDADVIGFGFGIITRTSGAHRTHWCSRSRSVPQLGHWLRCSNGPRCGRRSPPFSWSRAIRSSTLTNGGLGCALFWPFDDTRYFAPWRPIPVSPIGLGFFSAYGMFIAVVELVVFSPLFWFGLSARSRALLPY